MALIDSTTGPGAWRGSAFTDARRIACTLLLIFTPPAMAAQAPADLFERSIEELAQLRVVSVSRRSEPVRHAPSAIYVITDEEIRRSGYTTLPEILRLAPGVEVARRGAHSWTISIRGFNSNLSNKLLVLIDGRSVYSPLFAGVFWDAQDTLIPDIARIEVISGPGSTLWGENAVNGVINIITKHARNTRGLLVDAGAGDEQRVLANLRYGWDVSDDLAARAYVKYADRDASALPDGGDAFDEWWTARAGFRLDWSIGEAERLKVQGDVYDAELKDLLRGDFTLGTLPGPDRPGSVDISGYNLLARWLRDTAGGGHVRLQAYWDNTDRNIPGSFSERRHTVDVDFQHELRLGGHHVVWGAGYRWTRDDLDNTLFATFTPEEQTDETYRLFLQDEVRLWSDELLLTFGFDLNHNDYTGFEWHPNVRFTWLVDDRHTVWAAVTRAVRIPARLDTDLVLTAPLDIGAGIPLYANIVGSDDFKSEELIAKELGYRVLAADNLSLDIAVFHNDYDRLQTQELGATFVVGDPPAYLVLPGTLGNGMKGETWGGTFVGTWQALADWRLQFQYAYLDFDLALKEGSLGENGLAIDGNSPKHQAAVYSFVELPSDLELFAGLRYVDDLPAQAVPARVALDVSIGWRATENLRLSLTARDLNDDTHAEFGDSNLIERSVWLRATWRP